MLSKTRASPKITAEPSEIYKAKSENSTLNQSKTGIHMKSLFIVGWWVECGVLTPCFWGVPGLGWGEEERGTAVMSSLGLFVPAREEERSWLDGGMEKVEVKTSGALTGEEVRDFYQSMFQQEDEGGKKKENRRTSRRTSRRPERRRWGEWFQQTSQV